jgi:hypothetical protein
MRRLYPLSILLLITFTTWSQTRSWNGGNGDWNDITKWSPIGVPVETDILDFSTASGTISNVPNLTLKGIIVSGSDIILNAAAGSSKTLTISGDGSNADIIIHADASLTIGNNLDISLAKNNLAAIDGVLIVTTNRKYITNTSGSTKTTVRGVVRNSGGVIESETSTLEFEEGSVYEHAMDKGVIPAATWNKNSNCNIEGVVSNAPGGIEQVFGNYMWNCQNQKSGILSGKVLPEDIKGNLIINNIGSATDLNHFIQLPDKIDIEGNFVLNNGTLLTQGTTSTIVLKGDFIMTGGIIKAIAATANSIININFSGNSGQSFSKSGGLIEKSNGANKRGEVKFTILENAAVDFGESILNGDASFTLAKGGKLITAHADGISATGASGSIQVTGTRTYSTEADYAYTGSSHQNTGTGLPTIVRRLIIDNNSGVLSGAGVTLTKPVVISNELVLQNSFLQSSKDNVITIINGANATALNNSFVEGPIRKAGSSAFTFPTGWSGSGGGLIPIGISSMSTTSVIQAEYKRAPATNKGNTISAPLHHISYCDYWELFPVSGNPTAMVTMYRNSHSNCNPVSIVQDYTTVRVARSNGSVWNQVGNANGSMNAGIGYINSDSAGITINKTDIYYALGNISSSRDPLPVLYDSVAAYLKNNVVNIEWSNLTERDIATYFVERSVNGKDFSIISQHLPKSNRDDKASYLSIDPEPVPGTSYYRIKTIEKNTKIIFSKIIRVETDQPIQNFTLYPNPLKGSHLSLSLSGVKEGKYCIRVTNTTGQVLHQKDIINQGDFTTQLLELPSYIKPGVYNIIVKGDNYQQSKMFIVQ